MDYIQALLRNASPPFHKIGATPMTNHLQQICAANAELLAVQQAAVSFAELWQQAVDLPPARDFLAALKRKIAAGQAAVIAEMKRKSPSGGEIRADFDPVSLAASYQQGGAAALSILTEARWFGGRLEDIAAVRASGCPLPILRKDFTLAPYHIAQARVMGADAVLLIVAALSDAVLSECLDAAQQLGMTVLVEVHDAAELAQALRHQPRLVGINNRNLKTLKTDLSTTLTLAPTVQGDITLVAESGLKSAQDLAACRRIGVHSFLIGEHLLRQPNPGLGLRELLGGGG